jgi:methyl-accepting chemotaxis protein PixJ
MLNKTDTAKSGDAQNRASLISSEKVSSSIVKMPGAMTVGENDSQNSLVDRFKRLSLGTKATLLAIAIGTLPVLGVGALAYSISSNSLGEKISGLQQAEAEGLADKVNRFIFERYGDIQVLSSLPILTNPQIRASSTQTQKQAILDKFIQTYKIYDSIAVFDLNGEAIAQSQGDPIPNQGGQEYFKTVKEKDTVYIGQPGVDESTRQVVIFFAAPVKDEATGQNIGIVRSRMPVKALEEVAKNYSSAGQEFHLVDKSGKFFIATEKNHVNRIATQDFPGFEEEKNKKTEGTFVTVDKIDSKEQLVSYATKRLEGLPDLNWQVLLARDTANAFEARNKLGMLITLSSIAVAALAAFIGSLLAKRATEPIVDATAAVARLGDGEFSTRLQITRQDEIGVLGANINQMAEQLQVLVKEQEEDTERARILTDITLRIRRTLKTEEIYKTSVRELRQALKTDRVVIYNFDKSKWDGTVVAESVAPGLPKMTGEYFDDPCFKERHVETYKDGRIRAIANIYQDSSLKNAACYIKMLEKYGVKANLIAPIIVSEELAGLLIAHQCDNPRNWQQPDIDLFKQIATQVGYALEQAKLVEEIEGARSKAEGAQEDERRQKEELQMQLLELLSDVEGAASGDLTVRADVTAGEIGTVADFFNSIVESLRDIVTQVKQAASQVNASVGGQSGAIQELAEDAAAQTKEINRTLSAVEQMTNSIQTVAMSAQQAAIVANSAARTAERSGQAMDMTVQNILSLRETIGETAKKVKRLGESTQQITRVVSLINQIATQTNLLAINAGIEAARAGEEGQGFAVVAEEVGELANQSATATKEIEQIVENIQRETTDVVKAMELGTTQVVEGTRIVEDAKLSLGQILEISRQIDALVQSISTATGSQVQTSQAVGQLMREIAQVSQRTSTSSHKVSASLQQTVDISQKLQETVGTFKVS